MIIKKEKKGNIMIYYVEKDIDDNKLIKLLNKKLSNKDINFIIDHDANVYTKDNKLLLIFRKNKLNKNYTKEFYDNIIKFASLPTNNRGSASGSESKNVYKNPKILTNIIGYFDKFSPMQKFLLKQKGIKLQTTARETRFNVDYPEQFKKLLPLIKQIDELYKKYIPDKYEKQKKKANQTPFHIPNTSFTTVTTNVNFQTTVHKDKGDDNEGFGNLSIIEHGNYEGGETCLPQYKLGVNVRTGDILYMDVHEAHGNLPIILKSPDAKRLSIVCYLRKNIWEQTKGKTKKFMLKHNETIKKLRKNPS